MFNYVAFFILVFGAINWFCIGIFQFDLIAGVFGSQANFISRFLYVIVGLCGIWLMFYCLFKKGNFSLSSKPAPAKKKVSKQNKEEKKKEA
ncbi:MAG: DUF378 domain-containing protein [Clostridia bacterium]|nr:DUF378 domain-containing protein [Clostridia bacterium]MBQ9786241.1 DUF378 domain-containing protein [Clostridia bacterium]